MEQRRDQGGGGRPTGQNPDAQRQAQQGQSQQGQGTGQHGQQGWERGSRQQQQFDPQGSGQQGGGMGAMSGSLADQIQPHMEVVDDSGASVGTVDHLDGDRIKLTRASSGTGEHSYLPLSLVAGIEGGRIRLRSRGGTTFGMEAGR